jgi:hypothetical protein
MASNGEGDWSRPYEETGMSRRMLFIWLSLTLLSFANGRSLKSFILKQPVHQLGVVHFS